MSPASRLAASLFGEPVRFDFEIVNLTESAPDRAVRRRAGPRFRRREQRHQPDPLEVVRKTWPLPRPPPNSCSSPTPARPSRCMDRVPSQMAHICRAGNYQARGALRFRRIPGQPLAPNELGSAAGDIHGALKTFPQVHPRRAPASYRWQTRKSGARREIQSLQRRLGRRHRPRPARCRVWGRARTQYSEFQPSAAQGH